MTIADRHTVDYRTETVAALGISATFSGTALDMTPSPTPFERFEATFTSSHDGTAKIQASTDGTTWYDVASAAQVANTPVTLSVTPCARYLRVQQVNGATAQTSNSVFSALRKMLF